MNNNCYRARIRDLIYLCPHGALAEIRNTRPLYFFGLPRRHFVSPRNDAKHESFKYSVIARSSACRTTKQSKKNIKKMFIMLMSNQIAILHVGIFSEKPENKEFAFISGGLASVNKVFCYFSIENRVVGFANPTYFTTEILAVG